MIPKHGPRQKFVFPPKTPGVATYEYPNNYFVYTGEWKDSKKQGRGKLSIGQHSYYEGDFLNGEITGKGVRVFQNGSKYEGSFVDGEFHGQGIFENPTTGEKYEGEWKMNRHDGEGVLNLPDKTVYSGSFKEHKRHGQGKYTDISGNKYVGSWVNDKIEGNGKMDYENGDSYEGYFTAGKRHGQGTMTWKSNGLSVTGNWQNDKIDYAPTALSLSELPSFTPGTTVSDISVRIVGGSGENGRIIRFSIEIGRGGAGANSKKTPKAKKTDTIDKTPRYMVLTPSTEEEFVMVTATNGVATLPPISIPLDAEVTTYSINAEDQSEQNTLGYVTADFNFVPAALANQSTEKLSAKGKSTPKKKTAGATTRSVKK